MKSIVLYPNPTNGLIFVQTNMEGKVEVEITDIEGRLVKQINNLELGNYETTIDLSDKVSGIYFVRFTNSTNQRSFRISVN